jgi:aminoglycoside phosphotransferase (APT) family kinase protein
MNEIDDTKGLAGKLIAYLQAELGIPSLDYAFPLQRLRGGFETTIYRFALDGAPANWSQPLVVRIYPQFYGTGNAVWESTVQHVLVENEYPVARPYLVCTDMSVLGGAFFVMDCLPGQPLVAAPIERVPAVLGEAHADLHSLNPVPLVAALDSEGFHGDIYSLASRSDRLQERAARVPWVRSGVEWLTRNRPPIPEREVVCHGDFHPLNILYADGEVTGVLDWAGFGVGDPAYDIGNTLVLSTLASKHVLASMDGVAAVDWNLFGDQYLAAYRTRLPLDDTNLDYYRVRRCIQALIEGVEGQHVWQHPGVISDLLATIHDITGVRLRLPT